MRRSLLAFSVSVATALTASAHFVFVVPAKDAKAVTVVFSEDLEPDDHVQIDKIAGLKLTGVFDGGKTAAVECKKGEHALTGELGLVGPRMTYGSVVYGLSSKKDTKPALLVYHPKAVMAGVSEKDATAGEKAMPAELVPAAADGKIRFRLLVAGKPVADAEGSVLKPDGKKEKVTTDKHGYTPGFAAAGRYAVWVRHTEAKAGEHGEQKYEEVKHYPTLVADLPGK